MEQVASRLCLLPASCWFLAPLANLHVKCMILMAGDGRILLLLHSFITEMIIDLQICETVHQHYFIFTVNHHC
jgi:hypothetical protein